MGFGLLFIGYFMTVMNVPVLGIFGTIIRIIGCAVMLCGVLSLRRYNRAFDLALIGIALVGAVSFVALGANIDDALYENLLTKNRFFSDTAKNIVGYVDQGMTFVFNSFLLWAVRSIAKETEATKISNSAVRNYIFICAYYLVYLVSFLPFAGIQSAQHEFALIAWILYFVWIALNIILLFNCYAMICDESDVEMEPKASKFAFINWIREETERRGRKAREADALYREQKRQIKEQKRKRRKK